MTSFFKRTDHLTILSFGCAEGQEPYSISIALTENRIKHKIYAVDIDLSAIKKARTGQYNYYDMRNYNEKHNWAFEVKKDEILIKEDIKKNVDFIQGNILKTPLSELISEMVDVIVCNNVLIYGTNTLIKTAIPQLLAILKDGGLIFTTQSEAGYFEDFPSLVKLENNIVAFQKKDLLKIFEKDFRELFHMNTIQKIEKAPIEADQRIKELEQSIAECFDVGKVMELVSILIKNDDFAEAKKWQYILLLFRGYEKNDLTIYIDLCLELEEMEEYISMLRKKVELFKEKEDLLKLMDIFKKIGNIGLYFHYKNLFNLLYGTVDDKN
jgi:SAM-dependent methyltransferase